ncbi:MAG: LuxR C-terminal-related transcriptional regulator [Treponema sp.]|jgi:LuxR family maltose regulon positive regulatory protein|nr:LuxR C-terminal-related transcriptional regulator [Treponema sp.]
MNNEYFFTNNDSIIPQDELYLERRELNSRLARIIESPVITVTAGEGYGKTHSIYSFLRTCKAVTLWMQVSERDNMAQRFWENYSSAIGFYNRQVGNFLTGLGFPETTPDFDRYISMMQHQAIPGRRYIQVFDDFHLISQPPVLRFLDRYFSAPLANITIILISRKEPAINSVSLLSKGNLSPITVDDLRFTKQEIEAYFTLQNISLSPEDLTQIYHDSEGWALAISVAAREMKRRKPGKTGYARRLLEMDAFRIMESETLASVSAGLRKFLIKLSLIEHWPLELLENLVSDRTIIEEMETFSSLICYDTYLHGYRIHRLFRDFLKEKQDELTREEIREVYQKAAVWCLKNNLRMDAAIDYERARNYRGLINLINSFPRILPNGVAAFFLKIFDRLMAQDPVELPADGDDDYEDFAFLRYAIRPRLLLGQGRLKESTEENRRAIALFEAEPPSPLSSRILAFCYNSLGALKILDSRYTWDMNIAPLFEQANKYYMRHPEPLSGPITQCCIGPYINHAGYPAAPGAIEKAIQEFSLALGPASNSFNGYLYGADTMSWVEYYYFCADLANAENFARQAIFKCREKNQFELENRGLYYLLRINLNAGNPAGIEETLKQLKAQLDNTEFFNRYILYDIITGWFYAQIGQPGEAASWLKSEFEESELNPMFHGFETLVKAKCFFAEKRYEAVLNILNLPGGVSGLGEFILGRLEMRALQAVTFYNMGEKERAFKALEDAWDMAAPNHLDMPFIELGEDIRALAGTWLAERNGPIPHLWLETIKSKASVYAKKLSLAAEQYLVRQKPAVTLSFREMEVLTGLSQGLTREKIACDAALSLNTVKNVISDIYVKLGALNRADAIRIATGTGLLRTPEEHSKNEY